MKAAASDAFGIEPPGDGQELGHARHRPVKTRIEAGNLDQGRTTFLDYFDQGRFGGQVIGVIRPEPP